jgi:hypothetical protein
MNNQAEEYRRKAEEAEKMVEQVRDATAKETYRNIAKEWRLMAGHAERYSR